MLSAYIDESIRHRSAEVTSAYALGAIIVDDRGLAQLTTTMENLRYRKNVRVHWRSERRERRSQILNELAASPLSGVVTICLHGPDVRPERARRFCFDRLLAELSGRGVDRVVVESRNQALDARDRAVLTGMRRAGVVRPVMEVRWEVASTHPALWAADCLVGLVTGWLGGDEEMHGELERKLTVIDIERS